MPVHARVFGLALAARSQNKTSAWTAMRMHGSIRIARATRQLFSLITTFARVLYNRASNDEEEKRNANTA
ncbi:hypothetical protein CKS_4338 [Pantoea stewartii subsp. stewartii DC283]|uniref:Uncharacterized protein n=1 Tax=Pantoea stewartii subsp. stewartii DC283 TaxID=660596 RepID=H3RIM6_PANSE|nr:hypothetical protein CKS_4338 [Pantoea stewartii subsp. stewartii DC283]